MTWDDFTRVDDSDLQDWSQFTSVDQLTEDTFERTGLDVLDDILGGGLSEASRRNLSNPDFDPSIYSQEPAYDREAHAERAQRYWDTRDKVLGGQPLDIEPLPVGTQTILGAGQGMYDLVRTGAGLADAFRIPGARDLAKSMGAEAAELEELTQGQSTVLGDATQVLARGAASFIPSFVGGYLGGFPAGIVAAGAQSFGSVFEDAQDGYLRQGDDEETARNKAYLPALVSGLITAGVTRAFGANALDAFRNRLQAGAVSQMVRGPLMEILRGAGKEGVEEMTDQIGQAFVAKWSYEPEKKIEDIVKEVLLAGTLGTALGGLAEGANVTLQKIMTPADKRRVENGTDPLGRTPGGVDPTRGNVDESGQVITDPDAWKDFTPVPEATAVEAPVELAPRSTRLRRGERGVKGAAVKTVEAMGVGQDTAKEFVDRWMAGNPQWGSLEEMRANLLTAFEQSGLEPETGGALFREDAESYVASGMTEEEARETVTRAKEANRKTLEEVRARNKARLTQKESIQLPDAPVRDPRIPVDPQQLPAPAPEISAPAASPQQTIEALRRAEMEGRMPDGRPIDRRERVDWLMDESNALKHEDKDKGWERIQEASKLVRQITADERARVPDDAQIVKVEGTNFDVFFHPSVQPGYEGQWQATEMDKEGRPLGHSVHPTLQKALKDRLDHWNQKVTDIRFKRKPKGGETNGQRSQEGLQEQVLQGVQVAPEAGAAPTAPALPFRYEGAFENKRMGTKLHQYTLLQPVGDRPAGATVSENFLRENGVTIPPEIPSSATDSAAPVQESAPAPATAAEPAPVAQPAQDPTPERSLEEERELAQIEAKPQITADEARRSDVLKKKRKRKQKEVHDDIIEYIADNIGHIRSQQGARAGTEGYYGELYKEALTYGSVRMLFSRTRGSHPDVIVDDLRRDGYLPDDATVDDLWEKLAAAGKRRQARARGEDPETIRERQAIRFAEDALTKDKKTDKAVMVGSLVSGDTFKINKQEFSVTDMHYDLETDTITSVELSDGKTYGVQTLNGQDVIYVDRGTLVKKGLDSIDDVWNPEGDSKKDPENPDEQMSIGAGGGTGRGQKKQARGTPSIESMVQSAHLPAHTKTVIREFLNTPLMQQLDWSELRFELWDYLGTGVMGSRLGRLVKISEGASASTFPHEIAHIMFDFLPFTYQSAIEGHRTQALKRYFGSREAIPAAFRSGKMTSREFQEGGYDIELYPMSNASEFLAHYVGDRFANEAFKNRNDRPTVWKKIREWFDAMMDALRRSVGVDPSLDQVYREMIAGVHQPDLDAIVDFEERNSFSYTARDAQNAAALAKGPEERAVEASHQLAQAFDIVELFNKHGAPAVTAMAQKALRFFDYVGIRAAGENLNDGNAESYQQLKARITDPYQRNWMARLAAVQVNNLESHFQQVMKDRDEAFAKLGGVKFLKKLARNDALRISKDNAKLLDEAATAMLESAHKRSLQVLREEARSDREIAELEGELAAIDDAKKSSSAMSMLMEDMVKVLASTPEGEAALTDPNVNRADIIRVYKDIKRSTGQPLFNENLMRWASYVISKNADVREALWAAQLARTSTVRAQMGPYEKKFLADLEQDPLKTIRRELRAAKKRTSDYERARFAYLTLNKEVMRELAQLQSALEAGEVAENILNDADWKAFRKEVFNDAQVEGTQKPFTAFTDKLLVLPSGREVNVDPEFMKGSKTLFDEVYADYKRAEAELEQWLHDGANVDDPNWGIHRRNLGELQDYLTSLSAVTPADADRVFTRALSIIRDSIELAGGRLRDTALRAMNAWARVKEKAGWWNQRWSSRLTEARRAAIKSHGIKWGSFQKNDLVRANQIWWEKVGNILHYSHQRQQGGFKVGDRLPSGETVTQEDMDQLKLQSEAISDGFSIIKDFQITQDTLGKTGLWRRALKGSENMVRRVFNNGLQTFGTEYTRARTAYQEAFRANNEEGMQRAEEQMIATLNRYWDKVGFALVWDRNADFAHNTIFDGEGNVFEQIGREMIARPNAIASFDELIDRIVSLTADVTPEDARKVVLVEWGRIINQWHQAAKDETDGRMNLPARGKEAKNATTRSRDQALAPYSFYEYGFKDSRSIATFAGALHSAPLDRLVSAMVAMEQDLQSQIDALADANDPNKKMAQNERARRNGQTYDNYKDLEHRLKELRSTLRDLTSYDPDQDVDVNLSRTIGVMTGILISSVTTTARNFTTGPLYIGSVLNRINGGSIKNYLWGALYAYGFGSRTLLYEVPKAMIRGGGRALVKVPEALMQLKKGNFRKSYNALLRDFVEEVGENTYTKIRTIKEMVDEGLIQMPPLKKEFENMVEGSFLYGGRIPDKSLTTSEKILQSFPAMLEGSALAFTKTFAPIAGDMSLNAATYKVLPYALRDLDIRLRKLYSEWKKTKYRSFNFDDVRDPINILTAKELFPKQPHKEKSFSDLKQTFASAGISLEEVVARFFGQLEKGERPEHFLMDDEFKKLAARVINDVNRPSPEGSPQVFQKNTFWMNLIKPFFSWKVRALQLFLRGLSVPGQHPGSRKVLWGLVATMVMLPALLINALLIQPAAEESDRIMKRILFNQEKATREPWERDGLKSQAIGWGINAMIGIPFADMAINGMVNDLPVRASLYPELVTLSKMKDVGRYMGGVLQTGDPTFRLPELISSFMPDTRAIFNRLESQSGKRLSSNVIALMRRHGQTELLREVGEPVAGVNYNALSPYGQRLENAAMNGDLIEFKRIFDEAVATAKDMGRVDPEKAVRQLFSHRNPYDRAFRAKLTEDQKKVFLDKLSDGDRAKVAEMERRFASAAALVGSSFNTYKGEDRVAASLGRGRSGRGTLASLGQGRRRSRGRRSVRLRRGTRNLRRRSRLSRA
jgi:hypothetical protein